MREDLREVGGPLQGALAQESRLRRPEGGVRFEGGFQYIFADDSVEILPGTTLGVDVGGVELFAGVRSEVAARDNGYVFVAGGAGIVFVDAEVSVTGFPTESDDDFALELWYAVGAGVREQSLDLSLSFRSRMTTDVQLEGNSGDFSGTSFAIMVGKRW